MARQTKEEKREAAEAERRARAIAEFRTGFLRDRNRKVYDERQAFATYDALPETDRVTMSTLYGFVSDFKRAEEKLLHELRAAERDIHEAIDRVAAGLEPFWSSNGLTGRHGVDIDEQAVRLDVLRKSIDRFARATGWRVREIESAAEREFADAWSRVDVIAIDGKARITRVDEHGAVTFFNPALVGAVERTPSRAEVFDTVGFTYDSEDDAWYALGALVTYRPL